MDNRDIIKESTKDTDPSLAQTLGVSSDEYQNIISQMERKPNFFELSVFSALWSEHCSYKNSIHWLKQLPKTGEGVLAEAGEENAGLIAIDEKYAVCFKIESHNHPSAIEPYQGAATGVGGIHRDIFTMGARPIAALNALRFGPPQSERTRRLLKGVVKGIGDYGNAFGVPTVGGEIFFDESFGANPLVNAMSVGVVEIGKSASARAENAGAPVFIVGSQTGKDGINGAVFASQETHKDSAEQLPAVQVGDPFQEKLLLEATLEALATGGVIGMQDMGAAGIACSTSETSARGASGMDVWLEKVPLRQKNMTPVEIVLSESQERMLIIAHKDKVTELIQVFEKWELPCVQIGVVTDRPTVRYFWHGEIIGDISAEALVLGGGAPVYVREVVEPPKTEFYSLDSLIEPPLSEYKAILADILSSPNVASKKWVTRQYDSMVGNGTLSAFVASDAALVAVPETDKLLALCTDCNPRYVFADPYAGTALAVAEAARNVACSGGKPLGITNCLNFGNPYQPSVYHQFVRSIEGMRDACRMFGIPVTGGNVSFYNQSQEEGPVKPTPTIGMVGVLHQSEVLTLDFKQSGDAIYLIGPACVEINASEYLTRWHKVLNTPAPTLDLSMEKRLVDILLLLNKEKLIASAHDVSDGGLLAMLAECAFPGGLGWRVATPTNLLRKDAFWWGEAGTRVVVSTTRAEELELFLTDADFPFVRLGEVTNDGLFCIDGVTLESVSFYKEIYDTALEKLLNV